MPFKNSVLRVNQQRKFPQGKSQLQKIIKQDTNMAKNWIAKATKNKGGLHRSLGIKQGTKIPAKRLAAAAKKGGKVGKEARLAKTLKGLRNKSPLTKKIK